MKFHLLFIFLSTFGLCNGQNSETNFGAYFSDTEIKDLNTIANFFQSELCGNKDVTKFGECITDLIPEIIAIKKNYIKDKISYRKQKKLYGKISKNTFQKIWYLCKTWRTEVPKYEYKSLCFSGNPVFKDFVLDLGKTSGYLSKYGATLEGGMGNGNYIASNIIDFPKSMNIEDRGVQIIFAIHYLTLNDNLKRDRKAIRLMNRDLRKLNRKMKKKTVPNKA